MEGESQRQWDYQGKQFKMEMLRSGMVAIWWRKYSKNTNISKNKMHDFDDN